MKKLGSIMMTAVLACSMAVPVFAAGDGTPSAGAVGGTNAVQNGTVHRANNMGAGTGAGTYRTNNAYGTQGMNGINGTGMNRYYGNGTMGARSTTGKYGAMNNTTRAYADNDGMDWGWLGLIGLLGLAGMRGRERSENR